MVLPLKLIANARDWWKIRNFAGNARNCTNMWSRAEAYDLKTDMCNMKRILFFPFAALMGVVAAMAQKDFILESGTDITVSYPAVARPVLPTAIGILGHDVRSVLGDTVRVVGSGGKIDIKIDSVAVKRPQGFRLEVTPAGGLAITGHDSHGAAYGVMELSRIMGVSPWEWWADVTPVRKPRVVIPSGYVSEQAPSVEYRGIFINDEDWGIAQWSTFNYEPWDNPMHLCRIGPKTNARIFELMLRLRANTYWPAMHNCTVPFFLTEGNREVAGQYGMYIGTSHCEPMASNTFGEWSVRGKGEYDYVANSGNVLSFWEDRVKDVAGQEMIYTLGMRGVHDDPMNGAATVDEQKAVLSRAIADQRGLIEKYVDKDVAGVPQVFIPYKEVLDIYNAGLEVPEDVTLMWCDDNYGYIHHFPTQAERNRKGGNGVYYHVSYWGRPHDYLWLGTFSPALMHQQLNLAYDRGIDRMWILNVGDIKPAEYQMELFMDMAWDIDSVRMQGVKGHLKGFLAREFGADNAPELADAMMESYRLAFVRKPEFMGNTREEEYYNPYWRIVRDLPWSEDSLLRRVGEYERLSDRVELAAGYIPERLRDAYFQLVKYPVQAAAQMNRKMVFAQMARHGKTSWSASDEAYDSIVALTRTYNVGFANNGKWHRMMDHQPRRLPVFEPVDRSVATEPMATDTEYLCEWNGIDAAGDFTPCEGLGYESGAVSLVPGKTVTFDLPSVAADSVEVELRLLPNHPVAGGKLAVGVAIDKHPVRELRYETYGRSEEWKENVLRNQAIRTVVLPVGKGKRHRLAITPMSDGVVLDQVKLRKK